MASREACLRTALLGYAYPDMAKRDILKVFQNFTDLRPTTCKYRYNDGTSKYLLSLQGTVPISFQGNTYNIPLCLWLMDTYPYSPPVCYVKPSSNMHIMPDQHVDANGLVSYSFLVEWNPGQTDLLGLLQTLVIEFGKEPPLYKSSVQVPKEVHVPISSSHDATLRRALDEYTYPDMARMDVLEVTQNFTDLRPSRDTYRSNDGTSEELLCLQGTVPIIFQGNHYNTPLCLWLMDTYPYNPPVCLVKPTANMRIDPGQHVDTNGKIHHPYLDEWRFGQSDLLKLLQILVIEFGKKPPVYTPQLLREGTLPVPIGTQWTPLPVTVPLPRTATPETIVAGVEDVIQCVMCLENMTDPRVLSCHHSFCKACLKTLLQTQQSRTDGLTCPTCRAVTVVREGSVENLPVDFKMRKLCDLLNKHK